MITNDRRRFQRLKLAKPLLAQVDSDSALILDVGVGGAFVEHHGEVSEGDRFTLSFRFRGEEIAYLSEVARTHVVRPAQGGGTAVSHTGVRFVRPVGNSDQLLQDMMVVFVGRLIAAHRANAAGTETPDAESVLAAVGEARRTRSRGFLRYRFIDGAWSVIASHSPEQPEDGFTVAAFEDVEELEALCRTYEQTDEEGRRLIRLVAELSARGARTR